MWLRASVFFWFKHEWTPLATCLHVALSCISQKPPPPLTSYTNTTHVSFPFGKISLISGLWSTKPWPVYLQKNENELCDSDYIKTMPNKVAQHVWATHGFSPPAPSQYQKWTNPVDVSWGRDEVSALTAMANEKCTKESWLVWQNCRIVEFNSFKTLHHIHNIHIFTMVAHYDECSHYEN